MSPSGGRVTLRTATTCRSCCQVGQDKVKKVQSSIYNNRNRFTPPLDCTAPKLDRCCEVKKYMLWHSLFPPSQCCWILNPTWSNPRFAEGRKKKKLNWNPGGSTTLLRSTVSLVNQVDSQYTAPRCCCYSTPKDDETDRCFPPGFNRRGLCPGLSKVDHDVVVGGLGKRIGCATTIWLFWSARFVQRWWPR